MTRGTSLSEQPEEVPRLALDQAAKAFGAVQALVDGSITLFPGEAHALVGENGAGKSTLVKILAGVYQPDSGTLAIDGQPVVFSGQHAARDARPGINRSAGQSYPRVAVAPDPHGQARGLSVADQQIVEIAKALSSNANVLVMDEPTAALTTVEVERLFEVI